MRIIQRFVTILPYLFPGIIPIHMRGQSRASEAYVRMLSIL
jgi:hypothetical protein